MVVVIGVPIATYMYYDDGNDNNTVFTVEDEAQDEYSFSMGGMVWGVRCINFALRTPSCRRIGGKTREIIEKEK